MEENNALSRHNLEVTSARKDVTFTTNSLNFNEIKNNEESTLSETSSDSGVTDSSSISSSTFPETSTKLGIEGNLQKEGLDVYDITSFKSISKFVQHRIESSEEPGSFLVINLHQIVKQFHQWKAELPRVEPFYAVKCNPDQAILQLLASLGVNFDCATMGEIDLVLNTLGPYSFTNTGRANQGIVYANPAKMPSMIEFAINNDVSLTVFDGEDELIKIAGIEGHEKLRLLLRLATNDTDSVCRFSKKFGASLSEVPSLLQLAKDLNLNVVGVSFHVGSGCGNADAYTEALRDSQFVFEKAKELGFPPLSVIDIGGGFPGDEGGYGGPNMPTFHDLAVAINNGIDNILAYEQEEFKKEGKTDLTSKIRFIAEPGRYFVSASTVVATKVYSRKGGNNNFQALYVDDGVYGSFNNVVYDHYTPVPIKLPVSKKTLSSDTLSNDSVDIEDDSPLIPTAIFGPTCDGLDQMCSLDNTLFSRCEVGDWIMWENMGAYTHTASFVFNGYSHIPKKTYCYF